VAVIDFSKTNLSTLAKLFSDEDEAYKLVEAIRWPDGPVCPHCGVIGGHYFLAAQNGHRTTRTGKVTYRRVWKCHACRKQFSVLVGTVFEGSHIPLSKWLRAVHMLSAGKNGVASLELHRTLGVSKEAAWFMAHRIRYAVQQEPLASQLSGTVEVDETYFGGEAKNMHAKDRERKITGRGATGKLPVVTLVSRDGEARSQVMKAVTGENVGTVLREHVSKDAALMTDQSPVYGKPGAAFASHETVDHGKGEYVRGNAHTNTAEGFFSQLKRSIDGTHHHVSERHLPRYLAEFHYRYSTRKMKDGERTVLTICRTAGKRLTYG
jgi:transposase-like protein